MTDDLDVAILHTLQQLQDAAPSAGFFSVDEIVALANLPRLAVALHLTRLAVAGCVHIDPQRAATPQYRLAPRGHARLLRSRAQEERRKRLVHERGDGTERPERWRRMHEYVLVVDDDPSIRSLVGEILELADYEVETATNGAEALAAIDREAPAVMLLDMRMPVLDGWGVARTLHEQGRHVPTVVMTAAENADRWCAEVSADACVGKPFELEDMLRAVATVHQS